MLRDHFGLSVVKFNGDMKHYMHLKSNHLDSFLGKIWWLLCIDASKFSIIIGGHEYRNSTQQLFQ
jgi:hypothetical protein